MQEAAGITMHPSNIRLLKVNPVKFRSKFTLSCRGISLPPFLSQFGGLRRKISTLPLMLQMFASCVQKQTRSICCDQRNAGSSRLVPRFSPAGLGPHFHEGLLFNLPLSRPVYKRLQRFWGAYYLHQPSGWKF